ncbi:universal stress protein [Neisseriaceae bacterium B1]
MYRKICVALDDSLTSLHVFQAALKLAQTSHRSLLVVHVVNAANLLRMGIGVGDEEKLYAEVQRIGCAQVLKAVSGIDLGGITMAIKILPSFGDDIVALLLKTVMDEHCQVVAMGTKGVTGLRSLLVGSVAEGVLRKSPVPVLLVRDVHNEDVLN